MNKTNCPNCGAALPQFGGKCEFCGTRVVDLTAIDFDAQDPTMFLLRLPKSITGENGRILISMWAQPELNAITMEPETIYCYGRNGEVLTSFTASQQVAFEMSLHPCADPRDNSLFKMETLCLNN
jgi:hypothetical protein